MNTILRAVSLILLLMTGLSVRSQNSHPSDGFFKKENIITGGTLNASFGNQITALGVSPYIGYSLNRFVDVAISPALNYISQRDYYAVGDKLRQTTFGPGAFVRVFPVKFLFGIAQVEHNISRFRYLPAVGSVYQPDQLEIKADCVLLGVGLSNGRDFQVRRSYYYFSVLWDVRKANNSPYVDNLNRAVPIIRAGYNIALFQ
jgi:hypothetical protein